MRPGFRTFNRYALRLEHLNKRIQILFGFFDYLLGKWTLRYIRQRSIAAVANRLDHAVEHIVFLSGAIGADEGYLPWDGVWPYWQRLTWRVGGGWEERGFRPGVV